MVATLRGRGERYIDFYYSASHGEGTLSERVVEAMGELGWAGTGQGRECYVTNRGEPHDHGASPDIVDAD